jgi:hypothetical protein
MEAVLMSTTNCASSSSAMAMASPFLGTRFVLTHRTLAVRTGVAATKASKRLLRVSATDSSKAVPYASYAVPLEATNSFITRPLAEILRDMNKRVPDKVLKTRTDEGVTLKYIPWYHANRMLSFYAPGWSGEVRSIVFSADSSTVSVVYRVTIKGSDGEAWRESTGTASMADTQFGDPVQKAEGMAFRRACARFGLGLYLYHEDEVL